MNKTNIKRVPIVKGGGGGEDRSETISVEVLEGQRNKKSETPKHPRESLPWDLSRFLVYAYIQR